MKALIAALCAAFVSTAALASEPAPVPATVKSSWSGIYFGAHGGFDLSSTAIGFGGYGLDGISTNGTEYGLHGGIDFQLPGAPVIIGIGGDYTWSNSSFNITPGILEASFDRSWSIYGRLGFDMGRVMPYVLAGYTQADVSGSIPLIPASDSETLHGWLAGAGMEIALGNGLSLTGEYRYTKFDTLSMFKGSLDFDTERHEIRAGINYKFNAF